MPVHLGPFVAQVSGARPAAARHRSAEGTEVVDAGAPIGGGWAVVVEQQAASLDAPATDLPKGTLLIAGLLFVAVLLLQLTSDKRRRATARRVAAHNAAFLAVLGHELRTPLTVIRGFVDTLSNRWAHLGDEQRYDLVDRLPQQTRRLNRVVDRLLLAANLQTGSLPRPSLEPVDLAPALERLANDYGPMAPLHQFVVDAAPDLVVRADTKMLQQILDQLVDNAVKYSPSGGMVRLSAQRHRGDIEIAVEDEGVGLPRDSRSIFEAFAQGEAVDTRTHSEGGVGLGLYIVRALCRQLGASVRAERREQGGARLVVTLRAGRARVLQPG
jgi:signal transduction histidine kinase